MLSICCYVCFLYLYENVLPYLGSFFCDLAEELAYAIDLGFFSFNMPVIQRFYFSCCFAFPVSSFPVFKVFFHTPCLFGLYVLLYLKVRYFIFCFIPCISKVFPLNFLVDLLSFFNSIFISAWVFFSISMSLLKSTFKSWIVFVISLSFVFLFSWELLGETSQ